MWWIALVGILGVWVNSVEPCYLSSDQPNSWVVSLWRTSDETQFIACVGTLIAKNYVTAPMICFQEFAGGGFWKGREFTAMAGQDGGCQQRRRGILAMGHPQMTSDKFTYNIVYLEVEPFDFDPSKPPVAPLPRSEKSNIKFMASLMNQKAKCHFLWFKSSDDVKNSVIKSDVNMISRLNCWNTYCPSGNRGCVAYFWTSESFVCAEYSKPENRQKQCSDSSIGAPLVCNGTAVGVLRSCYWDKPLMVGGFNKKQLKGIKLYRKIASGEEEVEPNGKEQEEPDFPKWEEELETDMWRVG